MDKEALFNNYLDQQATQAADGGGNHEEGILQTVADNAPSGNDLEEFKGKVRQWMEIDNTVKRLRSVIKERNNAKQELTKYILAFMGKFNIEDLNTKEGKLRYKVSTVKAPVSKQALKERLIENHSVEKSAAELATAVFDVRGTVEKHSLRRLSPPKSLTL